MPRKKESDKLSALYDRKVGLPCRFDQLTELLNEQKMIANTVTFRSYKQIKAIYPILDADASMCLEFEEYVNSVRDKLQVIRVVITEIRTLLEDRIQCEFLGSAVFGRGRPINKEELAEIAKAKVEAKEVSTKLVLAEKDLSKLELAAVEAVKEAKDVRWEAERTHNDLKDISLKAEKNAKKAKEDDEKKREAEKERIRLDKERRQKDEAERKQREEEERSRKEEEERQRKEKEQMERLEAEIRKQQEEEERQKREEEQRRQEDEERQRRDRAEMERKEADRIRREKEQEQEARRKEDAERKRQIEERNRKEAEEKEKQRRLEEEKMRRDVNNWEPYIYTVEPGDMAVSLGCVLRSMEGTMQSKDSVCVERLVQLGGIFEPSEGEESVSNIIRLEQTDPDEIITVSEPLAVAIPHCIPAGEINKEPRIKMLTSAGNWVTMPTTEVTFPNLKDYKLAEVRLSSVNATLVVVAVSKREKQQVTKRGGKFTSIVERRLTYIIKPGTFKTPATVEIEVHVVDNKRTLVMRKRYPKAADCILSSSHFVSFVPPNKALPKSVTFNVPISLSTQRTQQRPTTSVLKGSEIPCRVQSALCVASSSRKRESDDDTSDGICLMYKDARGRWSQASTVDVIPAKTNDAVTFDMAITVPDKFVVVKTARDKSETEIQRAVGLLEDSLRDKMVQIVMGQNKQNPADLTVRCINIARSELVIRKLEDDGYDTSSTVSDPLPMREGQEVVIKFTGNVGDENESEKRFNFNSHIRTRQKIVAKAKDMYAQKALDHYHGHALFLTKKLGLNGEEMLCDFLVKLPKPDPKQLRPVVRRGEVTLRNNDLLTKEVLMEIAEEIGDEWRQLAQNLGVGDERLQAIVQSKQNKADVIFDMLVTWLKTTQRSANKVQILCDALYDCGRQDIQQELVEKENNFRKERGKTTRGLLH